VIEPYQKTDSTKETITKETTTKERYYRDPLQKAKKVWKRNLKFYQEKYSNIDLEFELANALEWIRERKHKKEIRERTRKGWDLFFQRWLNKAPPLKRSYKDLKIGAHPPAESKTEPVSIEKKIQRLKLKLKEIEDLFPQNGNKYDPSKIPRLDFKNNYIGIQNEITDLQETEPKGVRGSNGL
jgi:hypothetical protein